MPDVETASYMQYSLNSLKGLYRRLYTDYYWVIKGDTRSSDYSSYVTDIGRCIEQDPTAVACMEGVDAFCWSPMWEFHSKR